MPLFETLDDMKPFVFCITDNGGATADRFTIVFSDGDYFNASMDPYSPQGVGMWGDGSAPKVDVLGSIKERVLEGKERFIRWADLPSKIQKGMIGTVNMGWEDFIQKAPALASREEAGDYDGMWKPNGDDPLPIYLTYGEPIDGERPKTFTVRDDEHGDTTYSTFRRAVLHILPNPHSLTAEEYHPPVDIWDTKDPVPLWDCEKDLPELVEELDEGVHTFERALMAPLKRWIADREIVASRYVDRMGAMIILAKDEDRYCVYRSFLLGQDVEVSADIQDADAQTAMLRLLELI